MWREGASAALQIASLVVLMLTVPLGIRIANARYGAESASPSYLPALEGPRSRLPFNPDPIGDLTRLNPGYVIIGDSMAGTRIDVPRLTELSGRSIAPLLSAGAGPAYWYLVFTNWVVPSGIRPRCIFIFFRDTNLTNVMFRLDEPYRWMIDLVAHDREDELNAVVAARVAGPWYRIEETVANAYGADRARRWMEPALSGWIGRTLIASRRRRTEFMTGMNARFGLDHQRAMEAADIRIAEDRDASFQRYVDRSILPLLVRDAKAAGLQVCFVRVQRRPVGGQPPSQSPALRRYIRDLRAYIESNGALLRDDTGDPELTLDMYEDGDHVAAGARRRYTEIFVKRLRPLFAETGTR
jgi:hypothetical protein